MSLYHIILYSGVWERAVDAAYTNLKMPLLLSPRGKTRVFSKDLWGNLKPRVSPDRTETGPGSRNI